MFRLMVCVVLFNICLSLAVIAIMTGYYMTSGGLLLVALWLASLCDSCEI